LPEPPIIDKEVTDMVFAEKCSSCMRFDVQYSMMYDDQKWKELGAHDDNFAAVLKGSLDVVNESDQYDFWTESDDGSRLWIDKAMVVDNAGIHERVEKTATISLSKGIHPILVQFLDAGGSAFLKISWNVVKHHESLATSAVNSTYFNYQQKLRSFKRARLSNETSTFEKADRICGADPAAYIRVVLPRFQAKGSSSKSSQCIISAFDESHEKEGFQMIFSMKSSCRSARMLVYDMGMSQQASRLLGTECHVELLEPPSVMPEFARKFERHNKGFKPLVIADAISRGCLTGYWADTSTRAKTICADGNLREAAISLYRFDNGVFPNSGMTHPGMYKFFTISQANDAVEQLESGNIMFNASYPLWQDVLCRWLYCCMHKECVLPDGAIIIGEPPRERIDGITYHAHRDDQSALNLALIDSIQFRRLNLTNFQYHLPNTYYNFLNSRVSSHITSGINVQTLVEDFCKKPPPHDSIPAARHHVVNHHEYNIVLSASLTEVVHETPYSLLLPLSARSWLAFGFRPIIVLVVHSPQTWKISPSGSLLIQELESIPNCAVFLLPSPTTFIEVSLSQIVRLFVSFLLPDSELDTYLRISDADMIMYQGWPFKTANVSGVHIYNGDCCLPQRPMHSIGMTVRLWRQLFGPVLGMQNMKYSSEELSKKVMLWIMSQGVDISHAVQFAGREWSLDQVIAGEVINKMDKMIVLTVSPVVGRVHYPHHPLTEDVVESHEHQIKKSQLSKLQERIDFSALRTMAPFRNWTYTKWYQKVVNSEKSH